MGDINSFFSDKMPSKRNCSKCCLGNCNKPVSHLLISMHLHVNGAACDSCKKELDKECIVDQENASLKNNGKKIKTRNVKFEGNGKFDTNTIDAYGSPLSEFDIPIMEWVRIYD